MNVGIYKDEQAIGHAAASIFAAQVIAKPDSVLGLATGSSPVPVYNCLIEMYNKGIVDFSKVTTFNLDEYIGLTHDHPQSYYYFMQKNLFCGINVNKEAIHVPCGVAQDIESEGANYDKMIGAAGGIDVQILGIGNNGHIAFNEPCDEFPMLTHKVALTESTIEANKRFFDDKTEVPRFAISMGIGSIMKARKIILVAMGKAKAQAVHDMVKGPVTPQCPASVLQLHPDVTVFADEAAASML